MDYADDPALDLQRGYAYRNRLLIAAGFDGLTDEQVSLPAPVLITRENAAVPKVDLAPGGAPPEPAG
ncbi:hypothetical protein ABZ816_00245 [Actinosynnema sp. NPDC047251]|uniref:Uncharacterized protein n=1 Tax=Saccharothrix espanaensis (strain ATCC 51144 / DSM 44229 / JCM 9112 / NBRC 15066 / NRRL 15764) TaxID=1179773 RepID=K0K2B6_SACES|nr:hypothetical protein [Saccharothrix espanaensis]CCH30683.1 hypothetical protein BN6_33830 [Saccharothrix espanaensis DSM 44229]